MDEHLFIQGVLKGSKRFEVPKEWEDEVDLKGMTVSLTPIGTPQQLFVKGLQGREFVIDSHTVTPINCYYTVSATKLKKEA